MNNQSLNTQSVIDLLKAAPQNRPALIGGGDTLSYAGLIQQAEALATALACNGVQRLALQADNGPGWVVVDLACQAAGIVLVPLPGFFTDSQIAHCLASSGCDALLVANTHRAVVTGFSEGLSPLRGFSLLRNRTGEAPPTLPKGTGKITYTSGSTGQPKGVCLSTAQQLATAQAVNRALSTASLERYLSVLPMATLLENVAGVYAALLRGACVHLPGLQALGWRGSSGFDIDALCQQLGVYLPDSMILLPHLLDALIDRADAGWSPPTSLRFVAVGGARCSASQISRARDRNLPVYEGYGLSECASVVSLNTPDNDCIGSAGAVLDHCEVRVRRGHIVVSGNTFLAYLGAGTTAQAAETELDSGDLGELDDAGFLQLKGRSKNLIINSFGRNISPEWVESELIAQPAIAQCLVAGDARPFCVALIVPKTGIDPEAIAAAVGVCNAALPDYAQIKQWRIVSAFRQEDGLITANGRPRRDAIQRRYQALLDSCYTCPTTSASSVWSASIPSVF